MSQASGRETVRETARAILLVLSIGLAAATIGCSVRGLITSVPPRIFREVHALRVRSYQITPVTDDLRLYRAIEVHQLENLMLDQIPEATVKQLNMAIVKRVRSLNRFDRITEVEESSRPPGVPINQSGPEIEVGESQSELVVQEYLDDYTPGIPMLRLVEQGNNHAVLTVRIMLKDKRTARILGETNITVENARVTSNLGRMVEKTAKEVATFVERSTTHYNEPKEGPAYAKQ